jgi:hypothetical protein
MGVPVGERAATVRPTPGAYQQRAAPCCLSQCRRALSAFVLHGDRAAAQFVATDLPCFEVRHADSFASQPPLLEVA